MIRKDGDGSMTQTNWIGIVFMMMLIILGTFIHFRYRRKLNEMDGLGGIATFRDEEYL